MLGVVLTSATFAAGCGDEPGGGTGTGGGGGRGGTTGSAGSTGTAGRGGTGGSAGTFDDGRGEAEDARAALDFLSQRFPGRALIAGGYSFGNWVAMRVGAADERVTALIAIGTAITIFGTEFVQAIAKPALFVQGTADRFGPIAELEAAVAQSPAAADGRTRIARIEGAEHLFIGHELEVYAAVQEFLAELVSESGSGPGSGPGPGPGRPMEGKETST